MSSQDAATAALTANKQWMEHHVAALQHEISNKDNAIDAVTAGNYELSIKLLHSLAGAMGLQLAVAGPFPVAQTCDQAAFGAFSRELAARVCRAVVVTRARHYVQCC